MAPLPSVWVNAPPRGPASRSTGKRWRTTGGLASWRTGSSGAATPGGGYHHRRSPDAPWRARLRSLARRHCRYVMTSRRALLIALSLKRAVPTRGRPSHDPVVGGARAPRATPYATRHAPGALHKDDRDGSAL